MSQGLTNIYGIARTFWLGWGVAESTVVGLQGGVAPGEMMLFSKGGSGDHSSLERKTRWAAG